MQKKRTQMVTARVSADELARFRRAAKIEGIDLAEFLRRGCELLARPPWLREQPIEADAEVLN